MKARATAFVAGATGYTGTEVVRALAERAVATHAHVRPDSPSLERARTRFVSMGAQVDTTPWTPDALATTLERIRPTHVFALLGITRARAKRRARAGAPPESYESVDYGLSAMLLHATRHAAPAATFVYLSSLGASERSSNEYVRVRGRLEHEIRESHLSAVIVRPSFITGPDREESRPTERIAASVADTILGAIGLAGGRAVRDRYRSITARELGAGMVTVALAHTSGVRVVDAADLRSPAR